MNKIVAFPITARPAPAQSLPPNPLHAPVNRSASRLPSAERRGEYAIGDIARRLRIAHLSPRRVIDMLRTLATHDGMPLPETPRIWAGRPVRGARAIVRNSRWDAGRWDAWLDGRDPGPASASVGVPPIAQPASAPPPVREMMRERAQRLAVG